MDEISMNIVFPLKENVDIEKKEKEKETEKEKKKKTDIDNQIKINFHLPYGDTEIMYENPSIEVGYLKLMLTKKLQKPYNQINLTYNNNIMLDPLSIIDIIKENLDTIDINVSYID